MADEKKNWMRKGLLGSTTLPGIPGLTGGVPHAHKADGSCCGHHHHGHDGHHHHHHHDDEDCTSPKDCC